MKKRICFPLLLLFLGALQAQDAADMQIIQHYEELIKKAPDKSEYCDTLGMLYTSFREEERKMGNKEKAQACYLKAEKWFLMAIQKNTKDFDAHYSLGVMYFK